MGKSEQEKRQEECSQEDWKKARTILWRDSSERALGREVKLTADELKIIVRAWGDLGPKTQKLTLIAFPQIAAALLHKELAE